MFNSIPPITRNLIIINVVVFLVSNFVFPQFNDTLAAYYPFSPNFRSWQIITHMFMHGSFLHILFNMFTLFSFGPILEQSLGEKKFLILYFLSGLGAYFLYNAWNFVEVESIISKLQALNLNPSEIFTKSEINYSGDMRINATTEEGKQLSQELYIALRTPMVGASGAIFGVIAAFATLYPDSKIGIMFIPVPVKVKYLLPIIIVGSIYLGISGSGGNVAHLAHVGGAVVGFILAMIWRKHLYRFN